MPYPARLYNISNFMRYERPQKGRGREFWQLNVDLFGVDGIAADTEIIKISDAAIRAFGATRKMFTIRINDRRLTDFVMAEYLKLNSSQSTQMIKLFDRKDKITAEEFKLTAEEIFGLDAARDGLVKIAKLIGAKNISQLPDEILNSGKLDDLNTLFASLKSVGIDNAKFDITLMRGFDYYTGIVFEVFDNNPENNRSMFGGGRYDGLVGLFGVDDLPVVGAAIGETTIIEFVKAWGLLPELKPSTKLFVIELGEADSSLVVTQLRSKGLNVAVESLNRKLDKSIKAAAKMGIEYVLFVGEEEIKSGKYNLKNLVSGKEETLAIDEIAKKAL